MNKSSSNKEKKLIFFTRHYPYHEIGESFIEREILFTNKKFDEVIIYPSNKHDFIRELPKNVRVDDSIINTKTWGVIDLLFLYFIHVNLWVPVFISEINDRGWVHLLRNFSSYIRLMNIQLSRYRTLKAHLENVNTDNIVFYDYWFINTTLALCFLKKRNIIKHFIVRSHKMDVFDEVQENTGIPFRAYQFKWVDKMFTISKFNKDYFNSKIDNKFLDKISISYLGVQNGKYENEVQNQKRKKIVVSCAHMHNHKNIHLIPEVLKNIKTPVKWIHFGKGVNYDKVKELIKDLPPHIEVDLKGVVANKLINQMYRENTIDLFLSLSTSEGIPVSMMEAIANGIPILAYSIDGVPEIVQDGITGFLMNDISTPIIIASQLQKTLDYNFDIRAIKNYFDLNFNEEKNYSSFAEELSKFI